MAGCQWSDPKTETIPGAHVPLGRQYALSAGLMEITYDSGAKVLLQGPVTYEVESAAGGFLSVGKLTAKLEKRSAVSGQRSESASQKSEILNHRSLSPAPCPLFSVRTPTAIVTDLGTEFGVEVDESGVTTLARVPRLGPSSGRRRPAKTPRPTAQVLHASESARVEIGRDGLHAVKRAEVSAGPLHASNAKTGFSSGFQHGGWTPGRRPPIRIGRSPP